MNAPEEAPGGATVDAPRPSRASLPWLLALAPFAVLVARYDFLCDDAFISFRYARNLARGHGLVYNLGVDPPVEGYSELLWVLTLGLGMKLGAAPEVLSRTLSIAAGAALVLTVTRFLVTRVAPTPRAAAGSALFLGTLPPLAVWSTGGMGTMPFALGVWLLYLALFGRRERPRGHLAGIAAAFVVLVRADGALWVGLLVGLAAALGVRRRDPCLRRAAWTAAGWTAVALAGQLALRLAVYGDWLPHTARMKVDVSPLTLERGARYLGSFLLTLPSVGLAALAPLAFGRRCLDRTTLVAGGVVATTVLYAVWVGGDFMAYGRFLVPVLPFVAVLYGRALFALEEDGRGLVAAATAAALALLSLLPAFDVHVVPEAARARLEFRFNAKVYRSEHEQWTQMKEQAEGWATLGRALAAHTSPGESIVLGAVGAAGYYSDLFVFDRYGLVTAGVEGKERDGVKSPGHDGWVTRAYFLKYGPTYVGAYLKEGKRTMPDYARKHEREAIPLDPAAGFPPGEELVLVRPAAGDEEPGPGPRRRRRER